MKEKLFLMFIDDILEYVELGEVLGYSHQDLRFEICKKFGTGFMENSGVKSSYRNMRDVAVMDAYMRLRSKYITELTDTELDGQMTIDDLGKDDE